MVNRLQCAFPRVLFVLLALLHTLHAHADPCYVIQNESKGTVGLDFRYSGQVAEGAPLHIDLKPGGRYPAQKQWCWHTQPGYTATVTYGAPVKQSWNGVLVLGNGGFPGGTYKLSDNPPPSPPADHCIPSPYPGALNYCLKNAGQQINAVCSAGAGHLGTFTTRSGIQIVCKNGRKWTLTCLTNGTECNVSDHEFCVGLSQWNVGQHCTERIDNPNLARGNG